MSEETRFQIALCGAATKEGEIAVAYFASLLTALDALLQTTKIELYGDTLNIQIKLRATEKGSFAAIFSVIPEIAQAGFLFSEAHSKELLAVNNLLDTLLKFGAVGGGVAGGVIYLLKQLKGKSPNKIEQKENGIHIDIGDNNNIIITDPKTLALAQNPRIRNAVSKLASVTNKKGIDTFNIQYSDFRPIKPSKEDIKSFETEQNKEEAICSSERETVLEIVSPYFDAGHKWKVTEGDKPFSITIKDNDFINQVEGKEISFKKNDAIKCLIREQQSRSPHGLRKETSIIEVVELIPSSLPPLTSAQYEMPF